MGLERTGWNATELDNGIGSDGMERDEGRERVGIGWDATGWDGTEQDGIGTGYDRTGPGWMWRDGVGRDFRDDNGNVTGLMGRGAIRQVLPGLRVVQSYGAGRALSNGKGRQQLTCSLLKNLANSSSASSRNTSSSAGLTTVRSGSRVLSRVLGFCFGGASCSRQKTQQKRSRV